MTDTCESEDDCTQTPLRTLADLKVGDEVVATQPSGFHRLSAVEKVTLKLIATPFGRFDRLTGEGRLSAKDCELTLDANAFAGARWLLQHETTALRQREALDRVVGWLAHYKEWNRKEDLIVGYSGSDGKFELLVSDLIEVVKIAKGL